MHLGGGVGSVQDSLFHFKAGFSKIRNDFLTWQFIVQPAVYDLLVNEKLRNNLSSSDRDSNSFYFPYIRNTL